MRKKGSLSKDNVGYLFIAPFFIAFAVFGLYPIIYTLRLSFSRWDGIHNPISVGLANYVQLLHDDLFFKSIYNTILMTVVAGLLQLIFGITLAYLLSQRWVKMPNFFKGVFYFPNLVTAVSLGVLFSLMFDWQGGSFNKILMGLHLITQPVNWMVNEGFAQGIVIFILWFQYFGYYTIIFTAGIKGISPDILEAGSIDGANHIQIFTLIVLPLLKPVITYASIVCIIGGMQIFDIPYVFGNGKGEPGNATLTVVNYMYNTAFKNYNYGNGAAISYALFLLIIVFSIIYIRMSVPKEER